MVRTNLLTHIGCRVLPAEYIINLVVKLFA